MIVNRHDSRVEAESFKETFDLGHYIRPILEIYQASEISRDKWLTDREKDFYVATVVHVLKGHLNPISPEAIQIYGKYFNSEVKKSTISDYIGRIREKNWLRYDKFDKEVVLPPLFNELSEEKSNINFNLKFSYERASAVDR